MKKHINLLTKKKDYTQREKYFRYFRRTTLILSIVTLSLFFTIFIVKRGDEIEYEELLKRKQVFLTDSLSNKDRETKISYINQKGTYFKKVSANDMQFLPYYSVLESYLLRSTGFDSTESAKIQEVKFNNKRNIEMSIIVTGKDRLLSVMNALESDSLLGSFESLIVDKISTINAENEVYEIEFVGNFKSNKTTL